MASNALTLDQIRTQIRRRLGWPSTDAFVSEDELATMLKQCRQDLFDLMLTIHQGDYRSSFGNALTTPNRNFIVLSPNNPSSFGLAPDLQADLARIRKVSFLLDNTFIPLRRWDVETTMDPLQPQAWDRFTDVRYRLQAGLTREEEKIIFFTPTPNAVYTVQIYGNEGIYNTTFSASDAINELGNDEYLVLDGMLKCLQMEEDDTSVVERKLAAYIERLQNNKPPVDAGQAPTIQDVRSIQEGLDQRYRWFR